MAVQGIASGPFPSSASPSTSSAGLPTQMFCASSTKSVMGSQFLVPASAGHCSGCARAARAHAQLLRKYKAAKHRYLQLRGALSERAESEDEEIEVAVGSASARTEEVAVEAPGEKVALRRELEALKRSYDELLARQQETATALKAMTSQADKTRSKLETAQAKIDEQASQMREMEAQLRRQSDAESFAVGQLQQSLHQARTEISHLHSTNSEQATELDQVKARHARLQEVFAELELQLSSGRRAYDHTEHELAEMQARHKRDSEAHTQNQREAKKRIAALEERMNGLLQVIAKHSKERQKIMDNAFTSAVRLCVIAPTVTVEVDDLLVHVGPTVNEAQIREVVSTALTEQYNLIFRQEAEDAAPNGDDLDTWVRRMTRKLKTQIETQIASAVGA